MEKVKSTTGILKINLIVENFGGFGVKGKKTRVKKWSKFSSKWMPPELHQINGKGYVVKRD